MTTTITTSVRDFATPVLRRGSIDVFSGYGMASSDGQALHKLIQDRSSQADATYQREVTLSHTFVHGKYTILVRGRLDGLFTVGEQLVAEEIKSTSSIDRLKAALDRDPLHPYRLQVLVYGYLLLQTKGAWPVCTLRLISSTNGKEEVIPVATGGEIFEAWLRQRLAALIDSERQQRRQRRARCQTAAALEFPFAQMRPGQEQLLQTVADGAATGKHLLIQAPTGLGKTAGVMVPALKDSLARGKPLLYVTPKNSQHRLAEETVARLQEQGAKVRSVIITAKRKSCMQGEPLCTPEHCEYAKHYYDKISEHKVLDKLREMPRLDKDSFQNVAKQYKVCPFELSLEAALEAEVVICDYNYVFSPRSAYQSLFLDSDDKPKGVNLVIDEAHNLPQRGCDYYSPKLETALLRAWDEAHDQIPAVLQYRWRKLLGQCLACIEAERPAPAAVAALVKIDRANFFAMHEAVGRFAMEYFAGCEQLETDDIVVALQRYWSDFCFALQLEGEEFFTTYRTDAKGDSIKITCCDASRKLGETLKHFHAVTAFSATLKPFNYYAALGGFHADKLVTAEFASPFPKSNRKVLIIPQVSTKYAQRSAANYEKIGNAITRIVQVRPGNYFAFFPSYDFMLKTAAFIAPVGFAMLVQERHSSAQKVAEIVGEMTAGTRQLLVLAVQGGVFAEGVDYPGEALIGSIIVGPALPNFDFERELLRKFYDRNYGSGFDYAYTYPAMAKVVQAAGRVIRSETDRGVIVLMDSRFREAKYSEVMPDYWYDGHVDELVSKSILQDLAEFWHAAPTNAP